MKWLKAIGIVLLWWLVIGTVLAIVVDVLIALAGVDSASGSAGPTLIGLVILVSTIVGIIRAVRYLIAEHRKERAAANDQP